jgi:hypothetical protein
MTTPEQPDQVSQQSVPTIDDLLRIHVAMMCYSVLGLSATAFGAAMTFSKGQEQGGWFFFLFANLFLPVMGAFVTSVIYTVKARRHRPLLALCIIHILFLAAIGLVMWRQSGEGASEIPVDVAILSYGVFFTSVSIWWFVAGKRRMVKAKS